MLRDVEKPLADVVAVIVTFNPAPASFARTFRSVSKQVACTLVVDNASESDTKRTIDAEANAIDAQAIVISNPENLGLGAAHNQGIMLARSLGARFVLLLDQDSEVAPGTVSRLRDAYFEASKEEIPIAAVGPQYFDLMTKTYSRFLRVGRLKLVQHDCALGKQFTDVDCLISSGMLLPLSAVDLVGPVDESLFIDLVDTEWCFRARALGFRILGVGEALMRHSIGHHHIRFWFPFRWRRVPVHNPFRYYYAIRNTLLIFKRQNIALHWRWVLLLHHIRLVLLLMIVPGARGDRLRMISRGVLDGVRGSTGKLKTT
jgi:rhamnosyltransferase